MIDQKPGSLSNAVHRPLGNLAGAPAAFAQYVPHVVGVRLQVGVPGAGVGEALVDQLRQPPLGVAVSVPAGAVAVGIPAR